MPSFGRDWSPTHVSDIIDSEIKAAIEFFLQCLSKKGDLELCEPVSTIGWQIDTDMQENLILFSPASLVGSVYLCLVNIM